MESRALHQSVRSNIDSLRLRVIGLLVGLADREFYSHPFCTLVSAREV